MYTKEPNPRVKRGGGMIETSNNDGVLVTCSGACCEGVTLHVDARASKRQV